MNNVSDKISTRLIVISDLHLGGEEPTMCSRPDILASFIDQLPSCLKEDERLELVIAGDFIDFLALKPHSSWTAEPEEAVLKLRRTMQGSKFSVVFESLSKHVSSGHYLTIILGNHDVELIIPQVQEEFLKVIGALSHQIIFVDDGRAYKVGKVLIEHGNRYDGANVNDFDGLRTISSALSRNEEPPIFLEVSAGSQIVERVVYAIHSRYPFINLLQPEGELTALLLLSFEPALRWHVNKLARLLEGGIRRFDNPDGRQPPASNNVAYRHLESYDNELAVAFGDDYKMLRTPADNVSFFEAARDWSRVLLTPQTDSLSSIIERGDTIPNDRLEKIRVAMSRILADDTSLNVDGPTEQYGEAAQRIINDSNDRVKTVVMGHTHHARYVGDPECASYINTGTWADIIRVPSQVLDRGKLAELESFLRDLKFGKGRQHLPSYADIRVNGNGGIESARLEMYEANIR